MTMAPNDLPGPPDQHGKHTMEAWIDMLDSLRLNGGLFLDAEFTAPWCIRAQVGPEDCSPYTPVPRHIIAYHYVLAGEMLLQVANTPPVRIGAGEIVVLPRNDVHLMGSSLSHRAVVADRLIQQGVNGGLARIVHGGGGAATRIFCGFLGSDMQHNPVLAILPAVFNLRIAEGAAAAWIESSFRLAVAELATGNPQSPSMMGRIAELLFMEAVRRFVMQLPKTSSGWRAGMQDPRVAKSLALLHGDLRRRWTTEQLADLSGMSRSSFAERFTRTVGEPPMRYLGRLRLEQAAERLSNSTDPVARIAYEVGYESESAFTRAFARAYGIAPAAWRRSLKRGQDGRFREDTSS